ncbi:MAG: phosphoglycerate dehydrogenase [Elusimicrobiota bacterium]|jgi:D-3-phosphoglycerate dehydrogenase
MNDKVLIAPSTIGGYEPDPLVPLRAAGYEPVINPHKRKLTADEVKVLARECVGIVAGLEPLTAEVLRALPRLRCISRVGIGVDNIDLPCAKELGIQVCITAEAPIRSVVELTLGLLLDLFRNISKADRMIRTKHWERLKGSQLMGKTVGVIGLGRIGRAVAETLQKLDVRVIASDPAADAGWCASRKIDLCSLDHLLQKADAVTIHVSRQSGTPAIIGSRELSLMRPDAFLLNLSRGGVVDESALAQALRSKRLAGAASDVFEKEPYDGPLCQEERMLLSPHMGTYTQEAREAMERDAVKNLLKSLEKTHTHAR